MIQINSADDLKIFGVIIVAVFIGAIVILYALDK